MNTWLIAGWHWLIIVGVLLAILGILYTSNTYLDNKFLRRLTQSFTFGVVGGFVGGISAELIILPILVIIQLVTTRRFVFTANSLHLLLRLAILILPIGLALGILIGFLTGLLSSHTRKSGLPTKKFYREKNFYLFSFALSIIIGASLYTIFTNTYIPVFNPLWASLSISFIIGISIDEKEIDWIKIAIALSIIGLICILLMRYFYSSIHIIFSIIADYLLIFILGFLLGRMFNQSRISGTLLRKPSWKKFALWFVIGLAYGVVIPVLAVILLPAITLSERLLTAVFVSMIGLLIGLGNGEGNKILKHLKPQGRYIEGHYKASNNGWIRFAHSFLIAFISTFSFFGLFIFDSLINGYTFGETLTKSNLVYFILSIVIILLFFASLLGIITGSIYVSGYAIARKVERLSPTELGQIGIFFTILGVVIAALPSLI